MSRMNNRKKKKKRFLATIIILLIIVLALAFFLTKLLKNKEPDPIVNPGPDPVVEVEKDPVIEVAFTESTLDEGIKQAIRGYFNEYYTEVAYLKADYDKLTSLFTDPSSLESKRNYKAIQYLIDARKSQTQDLRLSKARCELTVSKITTDGTKTKVKLVEDSFMTFRDFSNYETEIYGIENTFIFEKVNDEYKISSYSKVQDFFLLFQDAKDYATLDSLYDKYLTAIKERVSKWANDKIDYMSNNLPEEATYDNAYDRVSASAYAKEYVGKRNSAYLAIDGNNCQNFASQVLRAGGIPNDTEKTGDYTTWFYESAKSYNYVWTYVPYFRTYANTNTGSGLVSRIDQNIYLAEPGDIVEVGITGPTRHTTVISEVVYKDNEFLDALLSSNTLDMRNFPVSAYVYPYLSLVKIYGWNN